MESFRRYIARAVLIGLSLVLAAILLGLLVVRLASAQVGSIAARSLSLSSPPNLKIYFANNPPAGGVNYLNTAYVPQVDGTIIFVRDASPTQPISGGGGGAWCYYIAGVWSCYAGANFGPGGGGINPGLAGQVAGYLTGGTTLSPIQALIGDSVNNTIYIKGGTTNVKGDAREANSLVGGLVTSFGNNTLYCPNCNFTQADVGKNLKVNGSGVDGALLGYGVNSGTIVRSTGVITVTFAKTPTGGTATALYESGSTWYSQTLTCTGAVCPGTLSHTPVVYESLNVRTSDGLDAWDSGPQTWFTTVLSVQDAHDLKGVTNASATNDNDTLENGYVEIGTDDSAAINTKIAAAIANNQNCSGESLSLIGPCNVHVVFDSGYSYMLASPIVISVNNLSNVRIEGPGAKLYSGPSGLFQIGPSSNANVNARIALKDVIAEGSMAHGSIGLNDQFVFWPRLENSTFNGYEIGLAVGSDSPSGNTSDLFNVIYSLFQYDGIGALFRTCDVCGAADSYVTGYHDRGIVVGDPLGNMGVSQTHGFKIEHVETGGFGYPSMQEGIDAGSSAIGMSIRDGIHETYTLAHSSAVRLGQNAGNVTGADIENNTFDIDTSGSDLPAIVTGTNNVAGLRIKGNLFTNWKYAASCGGSTQPIVAESNTFVTLTTGPWNNCGGVDIENGTISNPSGLPVEMSGAGFNPTVMTFNGTAGDALCGEGLQGSPVVATCVLAAYAQTGTAQTWTYPQRFLGPPVVLETGGSCGTYNPSSTATVLTLPANAAMTAESCDIVVIGE